jgi:hypothetical protein
VISVVSPNMRCGRRCLEFLTASLLLCACRRYTVVPYVQYEIRVINIFKDYGIGSTYTEPSVQSVDYTSWQMGKRIEFAFSFIDIKTHLICTICYSLNLWVRTCTWQHADFTKFLFYER